MGFTKNTLNTMKFTSFSTIFPALLTLAQSKAFDWAHQNNVLGKPLEIASTDPMTGFTRDGKCTAYTFDSGSHTVAAVVTQEFLDYTKAQGNDLSTPRSWGFPGLIEGNRWCLCVSRWLEAVRGGAAPPVLLETTNESVLAHVDLEFLMKYKWDGVPVLTGSREPVKNDNEFKVAKSEASEIFAGDSSDFVKSNLPLVSVFFLIMVAVLAYFTIKSKKISNEGHYKEEEAQPSLVQP